MTADQRAPTEEGTSKYVQLDNWRLHYHEAGNGPPLICLHGAGPAAGGWRHYYRNIEGLSQTFRTILVDLPGFGNKSTGQRPDVITSQFVGGILDQMMEALRIPSANLMGWSFGARTALKFAADYSSRVNRVLTLGTGAEFDAFTPRPTPGARTLRAVSRPETLSRDSLQAFVDALVFDKTVVRDAEWEELVSTWYAAALAEGQSPNIEVVDLYEILPKVKQKALLVWGRDEQFVTAQAGFLMLQRMPDAQLHVLSQAGHWIHWDKPNDLNRIVIDFFTSN